MPLETLKDTTVLGIMSGTSLDGLDLALCEFSGKNDGYEFQILASETIEYSPEWKSRLSSFQTLSAEQYFSENVLYGKYISEKVNVFLKTQNHKPDAIASHGHTVFHQPHRGFSTQIGCGATIASHTQIKTVADFRTLDVALGGQGAPLVPIGDDLLFDEYDACLNIGGIANISYKNKNGERIAYDIGVANMLLNFLAEKEGRPFDKNGGIARSGKLIEPLLKTLNELDYYKIHGAKSLGREWFEKEILNRLSDSIHVKDLLRTCTEHIAFVIANDLNQHQIINVLVTGGGAFNSFLIEKINEYTQCRIVIPDKTMINFKEALIFAFLGFLRLNEKVNTLCTVTGAKKDSSGGVVYVL